MHGVSDIWLWVRTERKNCQSAVRSANIDKNNSSALELRQPFWSETVEQQFAIETCRTRKFVRRSQIKNGSHVPRAITISRDPKRCGLARVAADDSVVRLVAIAVATGTDFSS